MCGKRPCAACNRKKKKVSIGRRRKKSSIMKTPTTRRIFKTVTDSAGVYAGYAGGKFLVNQIGPLSQNALFGAGANLIIASMLVSRPGVQRNIGVGMGVAGFDQLLGAVAPGLKAQIGALPQSYSFSTQSPGVAGGSGLYID